MSNMYYWIVWELELESEILKWKMVKYEYKGSVQENIKMRK